jgi:predicted nucleic acid-binding Zn ribbon protein
MSRYEDQPVLASERERRHATLAYFQTIHDVRHEVMQFQAFIDGVLCELRNDFHDITSSFVVDKVRLFLRRLRHFGHCPLSGDALNEMTLVNQCGHVFNKISLANANPVVTHCPVCGEPMIEPRDV